MTRPPEFAMERFFDRYEFSGAGLLCCSDCETWSVGELLALEPGAADDLAALRLAYGETAGSPALREAIAGLYDGIAAGDVLVHASGVEPIHNLMHAVLDPGDAVVLQTPIYGAAPGVAAWLGCTVLDWPLAESPRWHVDLDRLRAHLRSGARLVCMNTPHNPTGWHATRGELEAIASMCAEHGAVLLSDEAYRDGEHDPAARLPGGCELGPHVVSLGVLSKAYGLPGLRLGWLATTDDALRAALASIKDYTSICTSAVSEHLGALALRHGPRLLERNRAIMTANLAAVEALLARHGDALSWSPPQAGPVGFARVHDERGAAGFCERARREADILLLPSTIYGWGDAHLRIGFGRADGVELIGRLDAWLATGGATASSGGGAR